MEGHHQYEYVEGTMSAPQAAEIQGFFSATDNYYQFYDQRSAASMATAISQFEAYLAAEGPFDGVIGYSQGAILAATYMIHFSQLYPSAPLPFKCAIFFSGGRPLDPHALGKGDLILIDPEQQVAPLLTLPTANIWGRNDPLWPGSSETLWKLCDPANRTSFIHDEGHDIPGARAKDAVLGSVRAIRKVVDQAVIVH
jgi:predicted esterase